MNERDPGVQIGPKSVDQRQGECDLRNERDCGSTALEAGCDRLDVDRGLARTGHAVEQQRRGVALLDRALHEVQRLTLGLRQAGSRRTAPTQSNRPRGERAPGSLAHVQSDEPSTGKADETRGTMTRRDLYGESTLVR
jgi:hypothetical protein